MRFGSVCSGIEAASAAWHPLGWEAAWFSEIEPFPCAVLAHHYPEVPNHGDMTALPELIRSGEVEAPDLFCGGTPCQAFSVAGLRRSLDDARGNLSLTFCEIADAIDAVRRAGGKPASIVFWENVPGVLSTSDNAFGCFLGALAGCDTAIEPLAATGWTDAGVVAGPIRSVAWRVLDAQYFGLAQRRRRVFVVASAREDFDPAAVLLEWEGVRRDSAPSREAGQSVAPTIAGCANGGGANGPGRDVDSVESLQFGPVISPALKARDHKGPSSDGDGDGAPLIAHSLRGEGFDASEDGTGRGTPLVPVAQPVAFHENQRAEITMNDTAGSLKVGGGKPGQGYPAVLAPTLFGVAVPMINMQGSKGNAVAQADGPSFTLNAMHGHDVHAVAVAMTAMRESGQGYWMEDDIAGTLRAEGEDRPSRPSHVIQQQAMQVRRLTPVECERLQGFPDNYTAIPWRNKPASECPDGPRYKALGNSWAVPVVRWIGERISAVTAARKSAPPILCNKC